MKVLIVDDEVLIRIGILHAVDWQAHDFEIIGEAENGEEALSMIERLKPDIVLLDINMPKMSGIEVLKEIKKRDLKCKVIVLSCHDEFEYVKGALINKACDYILKHELTEDHILNVLEKVRSQIKSEKKSSTLSEQMGENAEEIESILKRDILNRLVVGQKSNFDITLNLNIKQGNLYCIVFEIDNYQQVLQRYSRQDSCLLMDSMTQIENQALSAYEEHELFAQKDNRFVLILSFSSLNSLKAIHDKLSKITYKLIDSADKYLNVRLSVGISSMKEDFNDLSLAYNEAVLSLSQKFFNYTDSIFDYQHLQLNDSAEYSKLLSQTESVVNKLIADKKYDELLAVFRKYFAQAREYPCVNPEKLKLFVQTSIKFMNSREAADIDIDAVNNCKNIDELESVVENIFEKNFRAENDYSYLIKKAVKYINEKYMEPISLKTLADFLSLSECYVSRIFNKNVNMSLPDYINCVRVEKSKDMLRTTNMKIYEIAEATGFNSVINFNIVFKKLELCTPVEYRKRNAG